MTRRAALTTARPEHETRMTTEPTANPTTTTRSLSKRLFAALPTRSARRHSMAWMAAVVAVFAIAAVGSGAMPQGSRDARVKAKRSNGSPAGKAPGTFDKAGPILAQTEFELTGLQVVVGPAAQSVPMNQPTGLLTTVEGGASGALNPNYRVRGTLAGTSLDSPVQLEAVLGETMAIPGLTRSGHHDVSALRVVDVTTGATVDSISVFIEGSTPENPIAVCSIDVIEQLLVSEVQVRELTYDEIVQAGISIDDDSYSYYNFALGLGTTSNAVPLNIPVAFPLPNKPDPRPIGGATTVELPDGRPCLIMPVLLGAEDSSGGGGNTPLEFNGQPVTIPGVIIIPGQIGLLHQYFEALLVVSNGAPPGAPNSLVVRNISAMIELPDAGTPADPSDDPLRVPETQQGGAVTTLPVHAFGDDGEYGTPDDATFLRPGDAGQAAFLMEGLHEGLHTINFNLEGTLEGLPIGPVVVKGQVPGSVLVRDRRFAVTFTHPGVVRAGQEYELGLTMTNTSENVAIQQATVTLSPAMISGATLLGIDESDRSLTAIPPGGSRTVTWRLRSNTTGRVTASYAKVGGEIEAGLSLVTGVGDRNVPLSPDSLILPDPVRFLPDPFVEASRAMLGQAWSVANAPRAALPAGVIPIRPQTVADRAAELGIAGIRVEFGESLTTSLGTLARDWLGELKEIPDPGFADALRETTAGDAWFDALGEQVYNRLTNGVPAITPAHLHREIAEAEASRSPMVSAFVSQPAGTTSIAGGRLIDSQGRITGFLATPGERAGQNRLAGAARLATGDAGAGAGATLGQFLFASRVDNMPWTFELSGWGTGSVDISIAVPTSGRASNHVVFSGVPVTPDLSYRVVVRPFGSTTFTLEVLQGNSWQPAGIAPSVTRFEDPAPQLVGALQITPDLIGGGDKYGRMIGLLFSKPMSEQQAEVATRYTIGGGELFETGELVGGPIGVHTASANFGNRIVIIALEAPIGPYIHRSVTASGVVDTRGVPLSGNPTVDIGARVSPDGIPPGGWVTGRVLKGSGEPVADADVLYATVTCNDDPFGSEGQGGYALIAVVRTDSAGRYAIDYVRNSTCGPVQLEARAPDGNGLKRLTTPVIYNGQHLAVDLVFLARGSVQGTVKRFDNSPSPNAIVSIIPTLDISGTRTVEADASGHYRADEVPVGAFTVKSVGQGADGTSSGLAAGALEVPGGLVTVDVTLQNASGQVSGTVRYAANPDEPVQAIAVAYANIAGFGTRLVGYGLVNPDHTFAIGGIPIGSVRVEIVDYYGSHLTDQSVTLTEAQPVVANMVFQLGSLGSVEGTVVDEQGNPLGNVNVRCGTTEVGVSPFGEYHIPNVTPGNQVIVATQVGSGLMGTTNVTVPNGGSVTGATIVISTPSMISGVVRIERSGVTSTVAGAFVTINGSTVAETDSQGRYTLRNVVGNASYVLRAVHPNKNIGLNQTIVVGHAETITRDLTFRPARLHGSVRQHDGTLAAAQLTIDLKRPDSTPGGSYGLLIPKRLTTDTGGTGSQFGLYSIEDVNAGTYIVKASSQFYPTVVAKGGTIEPAENETCDITLVETFGGTVRGLVTWPDGTPVGAGVEVTLGGGSLADATVRTIADGTYAFAEVFAAGNYDLTALDRSTAQTRRVRIALRQNQDTEVNLQLLGRGSMRVSVVDGAGNPVTGGSVTIDGSEHPRNHGYATVPTGGGTVEFSNISEGPYAVSATHNGLSGRVSAYVANGNTVEVTVMLQASGTVTGRVLSPDGADPVGLADVELQIGNRIVGVAVTSDADEDRGTYRFENVPAGGFVVEAFDNRSGRAGRSAGTLATQAQVVTADVTLVRTGTVTGTVTSNGTPAIHATVTVDAGVSGLNSVSLRATTDSEGGFIFTGIPEGAFRLTANNSAGLTGAATGTLTGPAGQPISVVADIALAPSVTVEGVVRAYGTSAPVAGARVTVRVGNRTLTVSTSADGTYRLPFVPLGSLLVRAEAAAGYDRGEAGVVNADTPGATHTVNIEMSGIGSVEGTARSSSGSPLSLGTVSLVNDAWAIPGLVGSITLSVPVQPDGTFRIDGAPAGAMSLRLTVPGDPRAGASIGTVAALQTLGLDVQLENAGTVTGTVTAPGTSAPASGSDVTVTVTRAGKPTLNYYTHTNPQGGFTVPNVPLGSVSVFVSDPPTGGSAVSSGVLATNGETLDVGTLALDNDTIRVVSVEPLGGATGVPRNAVVRVTFSEPALPQSVSTAITLTTASGLLGNQPVLAADGLSATIGHNGGGQLREFATYTVHVNTSLKDLAQRPMAESFASTFTTADETPPVATTVVPVNGTGAVAVSSTVEIWYSEPLDPNQDFSQVLRIAPQSAPTEFVAGTAVQTLLPFPKVVFTPSQPLGEFTTYVVNAAGARDVYGLVQTTPLTSTFRTKDLTPPAIDPIAVDGTTVHVRRPAVTVTYVDPMSGVHVGASNLTIDGSGVSYSVKNATTMTAMPSADLALGTHTLTATLYDVEGNQSVATATFTVDNTPPSIASFTIGGVEAVDGMTIGDTQPAFAATYSDPAGIDTSVSGTRLVIGPAGGTPSAVTATKTATSLTYTPSSPLANGAYTAQVFVVDLLGNVATSGVIHFTISLDGPIVDSLDVTSGSMHGGTAVTMIGRRLIAGGSGTYNVYVAGNPASMLYGYDNGDGTDVVAFRTPAGVPGPATVEIRTPNGTGISAVPFTYDGDTSAPYPVLRDTALLWRLDEDNYLEGSVRTPDAGPLGIASVAFDYPYDSHGSLVDGGRFRSGMGNANLWASDDQNHLDFGATGFTTEFWMRSGPVEADSVLAGKSTDTGTLDYGVVLSTDGTLHAEVRDAADALLQVELAQAELSVVDAQWHQVAMVVERGALPESNRLVLYVDGVERKVAVAPAGFGAVRDGGGRFRATLSGYTITDPETGAYVEHALDEIRISSTAHTASEIAVAFDPFGSAPTIGTVTPSGVERGSPTEVTVTGGNLAGATATIVATDGSPIPVTVTPIGTSSISARFSVTPDVASPLGAATLRITADGQAVETPIFITSQAPFVSGASTRLLWHLNETAGTAIVDSGPFGIGGAVAVAGFEPGRFGNARSVLPLTANADGGQLAFGSGGFTVSTWFRADSYLSFLSDAYTLVGKEAANGSSSEYSLAITQLGGVRGQVYDASGTLWEVLAPGWNGNIDDGAWHLVTMVVERGALPEQNRLVLFVDGAEVAAAQAPAGFGAVRNTSQRLRCGHRDTDSSSGNGSSLLQGTLDEIRILSAALTAEQVRDSWTGAQTSAKQPTSVRRGDQR